MKILLSSLVIAQFCGVEFWIKKNTLYCLSLNHLSGGFLKEMSNQLRTQKNNFVLLNALFPLQDVGAATAYSFLISFSFSQWHKGFVCQ